MVVLSAPAIYMLELTSQCDHHCPGCSNVYASKRERAATPLSAAAWEKILAFIAPTAAQLRLTGGEPTLHPEFFAILEAATAYDAWVTLSTHGHWRDPESFITRLTSFPQLSGLLLSLHGATAIAHETFNGVPGSFAPTAANAQRAAASGLQVALSVVITHQNWHEISAIAALAQSIGVQQVIFNRYLGLPLPGIEPSEEELRAAIEQIEVLRKGDVELQYGIGIPQCFIPNGSEGCLAGVALAAVDPWGNLRPCSQSPTVVGSLLEVPLEALWHSETMTRWRAAVPAACSAHCADFALCHGGCHALVELREDHCDPLRRYPQPVSVAPVTVHELPGEVCPIAHLHLRRESFGYLAIGQGHVVALSEAALALIDACDGTHSFAALAVEFGEPGLTLLGDLWERGLLLENT